MTTPEDKKKFKYLREFFQFYFAPKVRSVLTVPHFIVWLFITVYYIDYVAVSIQFFFYTALRSNVLISISHLLWGIAFICILALPFVMAIYSLVVVHRIWRSHITWSTFVKWTMTILAIVGAFAVLYMLDSASHFIASQEELRSFIEDAGLNGRI